MSEYGRPASSGGPVENDRHPRIDLGAYLLAILSPAEEEAITAHLQQCDDCVLTLMNLADTLPALRRLDPAIVLAGEDDVMAGAAVASAPSSSPPSASGAGTPAPRADVTGSAPPPARTRHRVNVSRRMRWGTGLAAIAAAAAAVITIPAVLGGDDPTSPIANPTTSVSASPSISPSTSLPASSSPAASVSTSPVGAASRTFEYTGSDTVTVTYAATANGGSAVNVTCQSGSDWTQQPGDASRTYELWIVRQDGDQVLVRSWPPVHGDATFPGWVDFPPQQFKTFQLRDGDGHLLSEAEA